MSANELLTLLGLAWSRLLIYPGGLALLVLIWRIARAENQTWHADNRSWFLVLGSISLPWLGLALLPLPAAPAMSRQTDIIFVLALLEWPRIMAIAYELRTSPTALRRLAAALNSYPPLLLATLALAQPAGTLDIAALARSPATAVALSAKTLHWIGATAWILMLPPMLGIGPFCAGRLAPAGSRAPIDWLRLGLSVRACALAALALLPWIAPFGALEELGSYTASTILAIMLAPLALGSALWGYDRITRQQSARRWAWAYLCLDGVLLLALLSFAYAAFPGR